jgi:transketolase
LGLNPDENFAMPAEVLAHARLVKERGSQSRAQWNARFEDWAKGNPDKAALLTRLQSRGLPEGWDSELPVFAPGKDVATRAASGEVINAIAHVLPEFWGGSADLAGSNNTSIKGGGSFLPASSSIEGADPYGRIIHFGIREHAMASILNGITLHGLTRSFGGTFAVFSDYMRPAVRLAALMQIPATFVWTHDSIGVGEDGPTHQPIEHLASLRAMPNLAVWRPADAIETAEAWSFALKDERRPSILALSRQNLPPLRDDVTENRSARGAYRLKAATAPRQVVLVATGSEVHIAAEAAALLEADGIGCDVVSMPCWKCLRRRTQATAPMCCRAMR